jgi:ribosomal protein S21
MFRRAVSRILLSSSSGRSEGIPTLAARSLINNSNSNNNIASSSSSSSSSIHVLVGRSAINSSSSSSSSSKNAVLKPSASFSSSSSSRLSSTTTKTRKQTLFSNNSNNNISASLPQKRSYVGVVVEDGNVDRAMRRLKRTMINEKMFEAFKTRLGTGRDAGFKKPSEKRVLALKERDRRVFKKKLKQKMGWILRRRERGF